MASGVALGFGQSASAPLELWQRHVAPQLARDMDKQAPIVLSGNGVLRRGLTEPGDKRRQGLASEQAVNGFVKKRWGVHG